MKSISFFIFILFITTPQLVKAQSDMVFLTTGDTLKGEIEILLPGDYYEEILVKDGGEKRRWKSFQLVGFTQGGETYKTIKYGDKYRFMKQVVDGYLGLYLFRADERYEFGTRYLYKVTNEGTEVPNITFKKSMARFVQECPVVEQGVLDKTYRSTNLEEMVRAFNDCLTAKPAIVAENNKKEKKAEKASEELELIRAIAKKLQAENIDTELATLLNDIEEKIASDEKVPGYLKNALKEGTANYSSVQSDVTNLIRLLE